MLNEKSAAVYEPSVILVKHGSTNTGDTHSDKIFWLFLTFSANTKKLKGNEVMPPVPHLYQTDTQSKSSNHAH